MEQFLAFIFSITTMFYILGTVAAVQIVKFFINLIPGAETNKKVKRFVLIVLPSIVAIALVVFTGYFPPEINPYVFGLGLGLIANKIFDVLKSTLSKLKKG